MDVQDLLQKSQTQVGRLKWQAKIVATAFYVSALEEALHWRAR